MFPIVVSAVAITTILSLSVDVMFSSLSFPLLMYILSQPGAFSSRSK